MTERDELILDILLKHPEGLMQHELAELCGMSKGTTARYLDRLIIKNQVYTKECGSSILHYHLDHAKNLIGETEK